MKKRAKDIIDIILRMSKLVNGYDWSLSLIKQQSNANQNTVTQHPVFIGMAVTIKSKYKCL